MTSVMVHRDSGEKDYGRMDKMYYIRLKNRRYEEDIQALQREPI